VRPRILILGASGFLGGAIRRALAAKPERADVVLHYRDRQAGELYAPPGTEWRSLDLQRAATADYLALLDAVTPDVVINCVGLTVGGPSELRDVNVSIVAKLASALDGRKDVHLIHWGSAAEYGPQHVGRPVAEDVYAAPLSAYGVTKFEATQRLVAAAVEGRIAVTVLRVFNPVGRYSPSRTLPGRAARELAHAIREERDTIRLGSLNAYRDYIDTRDVAGAAIAVSLQGTSDATILNVGRGEAVCSRDLVYSLAAIAGYEGTIVESGEGSSRSARLSWQCADITAIRARLGWEPRHSTEETLRDLWDLHQNTVLAEDETDGAIR
jgi:nucleoside-diphosphate-sugar epimerase